MVFSFFLFNKTTALVADTSGLFVPPINVKDLKSIKEIVNVRVTKTMEQIKDWAKKEAWEELKKSGDIAWRKALKNFLNTLAIDTATYIATGDKGQKPMFETQGWGPYLANVADEAAGTFLEELGKKGISGVKFNLCQPDINVAIKINLGLLSTKKPKKPACTFSEMKNNWEKELQDPNFLNKFQDMFNPWSNDLGIALTLQTGMESQISDKVNQAAQRRIADQGWLSVRSLIGDNIKTPAPTVQRTADKLIDDATALEKIPPQTILVGAIDVFINTLAGKLIEKWIKDGLVKKFPNNSFDWSGLTNYFGDGSSRSGTESAKERFASFLEPSFSSRSDYSILAELTACPSPEKAGPTNCVITDKFNQAIAEMTTVGQAMEKGYLNLNGTFGFTADGLEPKYNEGYPYRSMIILRKFRIIPVGWEVAAQKLKDEVRQTKNLGDLVACFSDNDSYKGYYDSWCAGLVDPSWVLKAPQNFCKKQGPGPEIISEQIVGSGADSQLTVSRQDAYCGDEQSCIKESLDGACEVYGYCSEERRIWNFNAKSCQPKYNTCRTFQTKESGSVSYLENTLDFSNCSADKAGCQAYCSDYDYSNKKFTCTVTSGTKAYLDRDAKECSSDAEGCHALIRVKAGLGANYLINSSFEDDLSQGGWQGIGQATTVYAHSGSNALELNSGLQNNEIKVGPNDGVYNIAGEKYALSLYARGCSANDEFGLGETAGAMNDVMVKFLASDDWQRYQVSAIYPLDAILNKVNLVFNTAGGCVIDDIKLELGSATDYTAYGQSGLIYEKILPSYLATSTDGITGVCYQDRNGMIAKRANAPKDCDKYARLCQAEEVDCNLYALVDGGSAIPARTTAIDYCPGECLGYDTFIQQSTRFDASRLLYFIPKTAKSCSAEAVGCEQFTNLDKIGQGAEMIEYFSNLRQCIKASDPASSCGEFYTWEGSEESGFQLKVVSLQAADIGGVIEPTITENDTLDCSAAIYQQNLGNPDYADCRQFYNRQGQISYHLYSKTISCTEDCHSYRLSARYSDETIAQGIGCDKSRGDRAWVNGECVLCKNGGKWDDSHQACIYQVVPSESAKCSEAQNGCREYTGNTGNNLMIVWSDNFEGDISGVWTSSNPLTAVRSSPESIIAGGHSLKVSGGDLTALKKNSYNLAKGGSYILRFIAKSASSGANNISAKLSGPFGESPFGSIALSDRWQSYELSLSELGGEAATTAIAGTNDYYIDNVYLLEITDRHYLIKNSWNTPASCNHDLFGNPQSLAMLGCKSYKDQNNEIHYLKSFSNLCSESGVGCELMIDTHNSASSLASVYNDINPAGCDAADGADCLEVPADNFVYAVYDKAKQCNSVDLGCQLLGDPYQHDRSALYSPVYLRNNPEQYGSILCAEKNVGCQEYAISDGKRYFKDPGDQLCEWRQIFGQAAGSWGWLKTKVKRCDIDKNGAINSSASSDEHKSLCQTQSDCSQYGSATPCIIDQNDYSCEADSLQTFGSGGSDVLQPRKGVGWAGLCPASQSGCSEYIDPLSRFSANLMFNPSFDDIDGDGRGGDGWVNGRQEIGLEAKSLYVLRGNGAGLTGCPNIYVLKNDNTLELKDAANPQLSGVNGSVRLYSGNNTSCTVTGGASGKTIELRKAVVDYRFGHDLDHKSCNGIIDFEDGCVLFNERAIADSSLSKMEYDADLTADDGSGLAPAVGSEANRDANVIIKVVPDRTCDKWLACRSYAKDDNGNNICYDVGLCNNLDNNNNCSSFVASKLDSNNFPYNQTYNRNGYDSAKIANFSGYNKVGLESGSLGGDYYDFGDMRQKGDSANIANGSFESYGSNGYPIGWNWSGQEAAGVPWNANAFSVVNNPISAQSEGIGYARDGKSFIRLGSSYDATSEVIDVIPGKDYFISAYVNTKNLKSGDAMISIVKGASLDYIKEAAVSQKLGEDWTYQVAWFNTGANSQIRIKLHSNAGGTAGSAGNFYFDDVKIKPTLNSKYGWYTTQTCRLYPQSDSLSCDYYEESGKRQKGWSGYCLEYDRSPGSEQACLLWYPIDKVKGDGIEEGAGYLGKIPVYYCAEAKILIPLEKREYVANVLHTGCNKDSGWPTLPGGYAYVVTGAACRCNEKNLFFFDAGRSYFASAAVPSGNCKYDCQSNGTGWYVYDGFTNYNSGHCLCGAPCNTINEAQFGFKFYNQDTGKVYDDVFAYCSKFVKTVTDVGANKFWSSRVYKGSDYKVASGILNYKYTTDGTPFGSAVPPYPTANPYNWDGESESDSIEPLLVTNSTDQVWTGAPYYWQSDGHGKIGLCSIGSKLCYHINGISYDKNKADCADGEGVCQEIIFPAGYNQYDQLKRIFAQSYGTWHWNPINFRYEFDNAAVGWLPPSVLCVVGGVAGVGPRPSYPNDYCAILPRITNIKINNMAGSVSFASNGFAHLAFNTKVDADQLPMVMLAVDWGDNETTTITGVEMRDRPNANTPHSLYHLYSYWDLKIKANRGIIPASSCTYVAGVGQCTVAPKVQIKDNWGWCNGGSAVNDCGGSQWASFSGSIVVKEK